jgi:hypothetical protein
MSFNNALVNRDASHYSGGMFSSTLDPRTVNVNAMPEPLNKVQAAASYIPCQAGGYKKINRRKINKISRKYKMKGSRKNVSRKARRMKSRVRSRYSKRSRNQSRRRNQSQSRGQKGGYAQYHNNMPNTPSYSTGGNLSPSLSALASPVPFQTLSNNTSCIDNYNHFENSGFPSKGWH